MSIFCSVLLDNIAELFFFIHPNTRPIYRAKNMHMDKNRNNKRKKNGEKARKKNNNEYNTIEAKTKKTNKTYAQESR